MIADREYDEQVDEDPLSRINREFVEQCVREGAYRPLTQEELMDIRAKRARFLKEEALRPPKKKRRSKKPPKGTAD